jgi:hypothetical protein
MLENPQDVKNNAEKEYALPRDFHPKARIP